MPPPALDTAPCCTSSANPGRCTWVWEWRLTCPEFLSTLDSVLIQPRPDVPGDAVLHTRLKRRRRSMAAFSKVSA